MTNALGELFGERLSALEPPEALELLSCAALLGYRFEARLVAACADFSAVRARAALERSRALDLIVREARAPASFRFRHALIQFAVRERLSLEDRRTWHTRIATVLEVQPDARRRIEQLAHHWSAAGDSAKAALYCERAAQLALRLGAAGDAAAWRARAW